jgi:hypothetical protein
MQPPALDNNTLVTGLGQHGARVLGVEATQLPALGDANLRRLVALAAEAANTFLADGPPSREELQLARVVREHVEHLLHTHHGNRPLLPRLRAELFRPGDALAIYVGDTFSDAAYAWVPATVTSVVKSQKPEFTRDLATRGFYWRVTAEVDGHVAGLPPSFAFSTTEPRVLLREDLGYLLSAFENDLSFLATYCANSVRDWPPIWALEAGRDAAVPSLPLARWLLRGSLHPELRALRTW